ncbi:SH3 domain-containing protein [Flavobacterium sp. CAU 1735]|uniref:SH3 domain-containing protein n=1 Tax=Flavobacterium sp. CAU 1735 TaxID=3140361 RepID=UPI00325FF7F2
MKTKYLVVFSFLFLIGCNSSHEKKETKTAKAVDTRAATPVKKTQEAGLILPVVDSLRESEQYCCVVSPESGFTVYDKPGGKAIGILKREINKDDDQSPYGLYFISEKGKQLIETEEYKEIGYDLFAINYNDKITGYVRVLDSRRSYWLHMDEINRKGFKTVSWMEHLLKERTTVLGYYANEPGLKLRKEPNSNSEVIRTIRGDLLEIKLSEKVSGQWCKVNITKYKEHPCDTELSESENTVEQTEGWLKIIDDNGEPNIWSYIKGC